MTTKPKAKASQVNGGSGRLEWRGRRTTKMSSKTMPRVPPSQLNYYNDPTHTEANRRNITAIRKRICWLEARILLQEGVDKNMSYDKAEKRALEWVLSELGKTHLWVQHVKYEG